MVLPCFPTGLRFLFSAPEVLARNRMVDEKVDMWALGVVMWVLLTGRHPFGANVDLSIEEVTRRVTEEEPDLRVRADSNFYLIGCFYLRN